MRRISAPGAALALAALSVGCANLTSPSSEGDQFFEQGLPDRAAEAYRRQLETSPTTADARTLFRFALASLPSPGEPLALPSEAKEALRQLLLLFPTSPYAPQAGFLLAWESDRDQMRGELAERNQHLETSILEMQTLRQELEESRETHQTGEEELRSLEKQLVKLETTVRRLREERDASRARAEDLAGKLKQLKKIDTQLESRPTPPS